MVEWVRSSDEPLAIDSTTNICPFLSYRGGLDCHQIRNQVLMCWWTFEVKALDCLTHLLRSHATSGEPFIGVRYCVWQSHKGKQRRINI